jgi:hypothetical protein
MPEHRQDGEKAGAVALARAQRETSTGSEPIRVAGALERLLAQASVFQIETIERRIQLLSR